MRLTYLCSAVAISIAGCGDSSGTDDPNTEPTSSTSMAESGSTNPQPTTSDPDTTNPGSTTGSCPAGAQDCPCQPDDVCSGTLVCEDGMCVQPSDTTSGTSDGSSSGGVDPECGNGVAEAGDLCFGSAMPLLMGAGTFAVTIANFDAEPNLDIVTANRDADSISIRLGEGDAMFGVQTAFVVGAGPTSIGAADFNGDGVLDIATGNPGAGDVTVVNGTGTGDFGAPQVLALGDVLELHDPTDVLIADLDDDTVPELLVTEAINSRVQVFATDMGAFLPPTNFPTGTGPSGLFAADLSGDGVLDILTADGAGNTVSLLLGNGFGQLGGASSEGAGTMPLDVSAGDFNGDGNMDAIVANPGGNVTIRLGNGLGGFGGQLPFPVAGGPQALLATDLDLDGTTDVAVATDDGMVHVLLGSGAGTLTEAAVIAVGMNPRDIIAVDLNDDGLLDLVTANLGSGGVSLIFTDA